MNDNDVLLTACRNGDIAAVRQILEKGDIDVNICDQNHADPRTYSHKGITSLHEACASHQSQVARLLLFHGANIHAKDHSGLEPLHMCISRSNPFSNDTLHTLQVLVEFDAMWDAKCDEMVATGMACEEAPALRLGVLLWIQERAKSVQFTTVPQEVIKRGVENTQVYIESMKTARDVVLRSKIGIVGDISAGQTSFLNLIIFDQPHLVNRPVRNLFNIDDRTIGIQSYRDFVGREYAKYFDVRFWNFAGHRASQVTQSAFFPPCTMYFMSVDLEAFTINSAQSAIVADQSSQEYMLLDEFVDRAILQWIRMVLARQPDAKFVFIITNDDIADAYAESLIKDELKKKLQSVCVFAEQMKHRTLFPSTTGSTVRVPESALRTRDKIVSAKPTILFVSSTSIASIQSTRENVQELILKSECKFPMPDRYLQVLGTVEKMRAQAKTLDITARLERVFVPVDRMINILQIDPKVCRIIFRTLHDLGDVLWYEKLDVGVFRNVVILDPKLLMDFFHQVINHQHTSFIMSHGDLMQKPFWIGLKDPQLIMAMKKLMQQFHLVYPVHEMGWDSDLVLPSYWQTTLPASWKFRGHDLRTKTYETNNKVRLCWEFHFEFGLPCTLFDYLVVASASGFWNFDRGPDWILYHGYEGTTACRIMVNHDKRVLHIEAVISSEANDTEIETLWDVFHHVMGAFMKVLDEYKGLRVPCYARDDENRLHDLTCLLTSSNPLTLTWMPPGAMWSQFRLAASLVTKPPTVQSETNSGGAETALLDEVDKILDSLANLDADLYTTREMFEDLIRNARDLQEPLKDIFTKGHLNIANHALGLYNALLVEIQACLQVYIRCGKIARLTKQWSIKNRVKDFYVERDRILTILQVELIHESATNQADFKKMMTISCEEVEKREARIEEQHQKGLMTLETLINDIPNATAADLEDVGITLMALADLKHEIMSNKIAYTTKELEMMKQLFVTVRQSYKIPREKLDLPVWYIPRADLRFDLKNPFATGQYLSLHYGTLSSGASVAINVVNVEADDDLSRQRFMQEIDTLSLLRDPHVLPFYGANHVGSPLLFVTAHAKHGDFVSYLRTHRDEFFQLFLDAARGLLYLHKNNIVHGNLKCSNLLVMADGTGVVSDFMFSFVHASSVLSLKTKPTTYEWTAPECLGFGTNANPRFESDVYSLGMCLIEGETGKRPFQGAPISQRSKREMIRAGELPNWAAQDDIQKDVAKLTSKMCAKVPSDRPKLTEVIRILEVLAAQEQVARATKLTSNQTQKLAVSTQTDVVVVNVNDAKSKAPETRSEDIKYHPATTKDTNIVIKIRFHNDFRRVNFDRNSFTFEHLTQLFVETFGLTAGSFIITYTDNEGDTSYVSSDVELIAAWRNFDNQDELKVPKFTATEHQDVFKATSDLDWISFMAAAKGLMMPSNTEICEVQREDGMSVDFQATNDRDATSHHPIISDLNPPPPNQGVRMREPSRETAAQLWKACEEDDVTTVRTLLTKGAVDVNICDEDGWTPLHHAACDGGVKVVGELIETAGIELDSVNKDGDTSLHLACSQHQHGVTRMLLESGANIHFKNLADYKPLHECIQLGVGQSLDANMLLTLQVLVSFGATWDTKCDEIVDSNDTREEALALRICILLWSQEQIDRVHFTIIPIEIIMKGPESTQAYIDTKIKEEEGARARLLKACEAGDVAIVRTLLEEKISYQNTRDQDGWTPLHMASSFGHVHVVEALLMAEANPKAVTKDGRTPLHYASYWGHLNIIDVLIKENVDVNATDINGETSLHLACSRYRSQATRQLLENGADIHVKNHVGLEPLFKCLQMDRHPIFDMAALETVQVLVLFGATWNATCDQITFNHAEVDATGVCMQQWSQDVVNGRPLTKIPIEIVKRGAVSTENYLYNLEASNKVLFRAKICLVGCSCAGKTSFAKGLIEQKPQLVKFEQRTFGIDLHLLRFERNTTAGDDDGDEVSVYEVMIWDFAGQDAYQIAHSAFFSRGTVFFVVIDLESFTAGYKQAVIFAGEEFQVPKLLGEYIERTIFHWIRMIVTCQPDADIVFVVTKEDVVHENESQMAMDLIRDELESKLHEVDAVVEEMKRDVEQSQSTERGRVPLSNKSASGESNLLAVSSASLDSIQAARAQVEERIINSERTIRIPDKYVEALRTIESVREEAKRHDMHNRIKRVFAPVETLPDQLQTVPQLCQTILETLHDLGDVLWYKNLNVGVFDDKVILDPMLLVGFVYEVMCHQHMDLTISHAHLMTKRFWISLDDPQLTDGMKKILQHFHMVYSANTNREMRWDSDLIVPAYWQTEKPASWYFLGDILRLNRSRSRDGEVSRVHWEYHFERGLPPWLFDHVIVASVCPHLNFQAGPDWILYKAQDIAACRIMIGRALITLHPTIHVEAVVGSQATPQDKELLWATFQKLCEALLSVMYKKQGLVASVFAWKDDSLMVRMQDLMEVECPPGLSFPWLPPSETWNWFKATSRVVISPALPTSNPVNNRIEVSPTRNAAFPVQESPRLENETTLAPSSVTQTTQQSNISMQDTVSSQNLITLKIGFQNTFRSLCVDASTLTLATVTELFVSKFKMQPGSFVVQYTDGRGDTINVCAEDEFTQARRVLLHTNHDEHKELKFMADQSRDEGNGLWIKRVLVVVIAILLLVSSSQTFVLQEMRRVLNLLYQSI